MNPLMKNLAENPIKKDNHTYLIKLHNTLTGNCEVLQKSDQPFRFYCCGPTVYGPAHIGNFRTFIIQDVLRRTLELNDYNVLHVRNITDIDDKTIRQSLKEKQSLFEFTQAWQKKFETDCNEFSLLTPHVSPTVSNHIPEQIQLIQTLIDKQHAYQTADGVYFKINSFPSYGQLANLNLEALQTQTTTSSGENNRADEYTRESLADFALWKAYKPEDGPNAWESPWGKGRPGWHIECSAMCHKHLGHTIDLHGGGIDLIFPHHVNEIAQSEGAYGPQFCKHWFHVAHLKVENEKMSKSLGNLYTLDDLKSKAFDPQTVRYLLISGHYRQPLNFTFEGLHAAKKAIQKIAQFIEGQLINQNKDKCFWNNLPTTLTPSAFNKAWEALAEDLNTPQAIGHLFTAIHELEKSPTAFNIEHELQGLKTLLHGLGICFQLEQSSTNGTPPPAHIQTLAEERFSAKKAKDFSKSDQIRHLLNDEGWNIMDQPDGSYRLVPLSKN
jgi:cysteinyl-tRNA synthetase